MLVWAYKHVWAMSPDGTYIISSDDRHRLIVWDVQTMQERAILPGHFEELHNCAISPDSSFIVSASRDTLTIWDAQNMKKRTSFSHYGISDFAISPDSSFLVSCGKGGVIYRILEIGYLTVKSLLKPDQRE